MTGLNVSEMMLIASVLFLTAGWLFLRYLLHQRRYFGIPWPPRSIIAANISGMLIGTSFAALLGLIKHLSSLQLVDALVYGSLTSLPTLVSLGAISITSLTLASISGALYMFLLKSEAGGRRFIVSLTPLSALLSYVFVATYLVESTLTPLLAQAALIAAVFILAQRLHDETFSLANKPMFRIITVGALAISMSTFPGFMHAAAGFDVSTGFNLFMLFARYCVFIIMVTGIISFVFIASTRELEHLRSYRNFRNKMEDGYLTGGFILLILLMEIGIRYALNTTFPQDTATEFDKQFIVGYIFVLLLVYTLFALTIVSLTHQFIRPIDTFRNALNKTSSGDMNALIDISSKDDIGELADAYNVMVFRLRDLQDELAETERQAAWSEMARQVAHEIKNPLTPMKLSIQHLYQQVEYHQIPIEKVRPLVKRITNTLIQEIDSLSNIATDFSKFARPVTEKFQQISVKSFISSILELYSHDNRIDFHYDAADESMQIHGAQDELKRVFINLIKNAMEAGVPGGLIYIRAFRHQRHAVIEIADTGKGMSEDVRKRIFVPNFSTKNSGTGLGLAISRKVIDAHKGSIRFASIPGLGTTFTVYLPLCEKISATATEPSA